MDQIFHPIWCCWVCSYSGIQVWHMQAIINTKQQQQKTAAEEAAAAICLLPLRAAFWNIQKYIQQLKHLIKSSLSSNEYAPVLKSYWENSFESIFSRKLLIFPLSWNKFALAHWRAMEIVENYLLYRICQSIIIIRILCQMFTGFELNFSSR